LIYDLGLKTIESIYDESLKTDDYRERIEIEKYAMQSENARRRNAVIEMATRIPEVNLKAQDVDTDPWLFNVQNGTIDLKNGVFREHRRDDWITKTANDNLTARFLYGEYFDFKPTFKIFIF
jgi:putative DNA primase/helicase